MCKIAIIPHVKTGKAKQAWKFSIAITPYLTEYDHDGFGYMALGDRGIFGERWLDVQAAWKNRTAIDPVASDIVKKFSGTLKSNGTIFNAFGEIRNPSAIALHARMATCSVNIMNTHPFVSEDGKTALIHNGVISNAVKFKRQSTCDSEAILTSYKDNNVTNNPVNMQRVVDSLEGYYACGVISQRIEGGWILDIFKEKAANLEAVYVPNLETIVFCTDSDMIKAALDDLKWKAGPTFVVGDNTHIRYNAITGDLLSTSRFVPPVPKPTYSRADWLRDAREFPEYSGVSNDDAPEEDANDTVDDPTDPFYYRVGT